MVNLKRANNHRKWRIHRRNNQNRLFELVCICVNMCAWNTQLVFQCNNNNNNTFIARFEFDLI